MARWPTPLLPPLLAGSLLLGCEPPVVALGGDCRPLSACRKPGDNALHARDAGVGDGDDATGAPDSGHREPDADTTHAPDAAVTPTDAGGDFPDSTLPALDAGSGALYPPIGNPSFELQNGSDPGDFGGTTPLTNTDVSPWYQCQVPGGSFLRVETSADNGVVPQAGGTFFTFQFPYVVDLPVPVYQPFAQPLRAGTTYAFMVDLRAEGAVDQILALEVKGGDTHCELVTSMESLAVTDYLKKGVWVSRCIRFTPTHDVSQLALLPSVKGVIGVTFRLYVDNIRSDPSCN